MFKVFVKIYFFTYTISLAVFLVHNMFMDIFISDKKERALEALLCSPLSVREIWMSKVLALFLINYQIALLAIMVFVIGSNLMIVGKIYYLEDCLMWVYSFITLLIIVILIIGVRLFLDKERIVLNR